MQSPQLEIEITVLANFDMIVSNKRITNGADQTVWLHLCCSLTQCFSRRGPSNIYLVCQLQMLPYALAAVHSLLFHCLLLLTFLKIFNNVQKDGD